jgi:2-dehydropantoate 2-reductase
MGDTPHQNWRLTVTDYQPPVLIVGTGALACLFAARLSAAHIPVTMLGTWKEGLQALRQNGVTVVEQDGRVLNFPVNVIDNPLACAGTPHALVLVKSWQTERAARQLSVCLAPQGLALTLQNGMGNRETLTQALGAQRTALGATTAGAYLLGPGKVRSAGEGVITLVIHARMKTFSDLFVSAGFVVETVTDASVLLWGKMVINAAINPISALLRVPNGELLDQPSARTLMASAAREAAAVAVAKGVRLPYPDPVVATETIARRTANNLSSMLQDVLRGAPTEISAICGVIVDMGEQTGVPTPINRTLLLLVKAIEGKRRDSFENSHNP